MAFLHWGRTAPPSTPSPEEAPPAWTWRNTDNLPRPHVTRDRPDYALLAIVGVLLVIGLMAVLSSSFVMALDDYGDFGYFFWRQLRWVALGGVLLFIGSRVDYHHWSHVSVPLMILTVLLLILVHIPLFGVNNYGATRWINMGPIDIQPSEFAKLAVVIYFSTWLARRGDRLKQWTAGFFPFCLTVGIVGALVFTQPDLGTTTVILAIGLILFFVAGASWSQIGVLLLSAAASAGPIIASMSYRKERFEAFLDPWKDPQGIGFHIIQSLIAMGAGGLTGRGLGASLQKFYYVPGSHTDAIFAIIGEELGLIGALFVMGLFAFLGYRGLRIAFHAPDKFGCLMATGITSWILLQAMINIGGVTKAIPWTGITLPFISYGGSSLAVTMAATGILLNISQQALVRERSEKSTPVSGYLTEEP